jgi:hypothetical protein
MNGIIRKGFAMATAAVLSGCSTPMFTLRGEGGRQYGPYAFVQGQKIRIGSETLVLHKELPPDRLVGDRMRSLVIPEIDFRDACIEDIVNFLREPKVYFDPDDRWTEPPVDIVLVVPAGKMAAIPRVHLRAQSLSLFAAVKTVARLTGLDFSIHDGRAWLELKE